MFLTVGLLVVVPASSASAATPCGVGGNPVACENTKAGDPAGNWQISGIGDASIQGYATAMSVDLGSSVSFKVSTTASAYHIDIRRLGYYQGNGARVIATGIRPSATLPQTQPACLTYPATGLIDCGNWGVSASWTVPATAVSGLYIAQLVRDDTGGQSQIPFVVRDTSSHSDVVYQTSDTTWQAYNTYGGNSLYQCTVACPPGNPLGYKAAFKVSYNRPFHTALDDQGRDSLFYSEIQMIEFMEQNGYDVTYLSGGDVDQNGSLLLNHKVFMSTGHDEYWSGNQRANVEAARDHGVNLAFFSGNEVFWKTRWEPSTDGSNTAERTLVSYKETHFNAPTDPLDPGIWTGSWRDPRFSPPADGGRPENGLTGQIFSVNSGTTDIKVPAQYAKLRLWRSTAAAALTGSQSLTLGAGDDTLGYEWDVDADNGSRPNGLIDMSSTTFTAPEVFTDYGSTTAAASQTHHLTLYRAASGALVFGAGTVQWSWGLNDFGGHTVDKNMQQATVNLFADMGAQPVSLISGLVSSSPSTDTTAPRSTITSPAPGATTADGTKVTVTGAATDSGGGVVAGVEVSTDGGTSWHPATVAPGVSTTWSYTYVAHGNPSATIESRASDDSANTEATTDHQILNITCPCSIFGPNVTPTVTDAADPASIELGVKFTTDTFGTINGIRFYKSAANTGTHVGSLYTATGQLLATATFTGETASGWQQVNFSSPIPVNANTTYVAAYLAPKGHYAADDNYFYTNPPVTGISMVDSPPLHALKSTATTANGVYIYTSAPAFPTTADVADNFGVDVSFTSSAAPGAVTGVTATAGYASAGLNWTAPTGAPVTTYVITPYIGATAQPTTTVTGNPAPTTGTVTGLVNGTTYTFTVTASNPIGSGAPSAASNAVTPSTTASVVQNGGFQSGLSSWISGGINPPSASTAKAHTGTASGLLGVVQSTPATAGDSNLSQTLTVPVGQSTLGFWYWPQTADDTCTTTCKFDWQEAQVRATNGTVLAQIFKSNSNSQVWTQVSFNTTAYAGQTVVLYFNVHNDGSSPPDDTWMYLDDVTLTTTGAATAPSAPTGVTATAGNGSANVSWTAPASGGSPITSYVVTPFIGATAQTAVTVAGSPPATTVALSGLTVGTSYTFKVTAVNSVGASASSASSNAVTPTALTAPLAPTGVTAVAGDTTATVSWTAPANGGSPITSYTVTPYIAAEGSTAQTPVVVSGSTTSLRVTGLTDGTAYAFKVTATNAIGTGPDSAESNSVTPAGLPGAPTAVTAIAGNASATVSWTAPASGGSGVTTYTVTPFVGSAAQAVQTVTGSPPGTTATISGLINGTTYTFTVTATNAVGTGAASAPSSGVTPAAPASAPQAPISVSAVSGNAQAVVSWSAPPNGGSPITSYTVTPFIGATGQTARSVTGSPPATSATITGLTNGTAYTFTVTATNVSGTGPASPRSNIATPTAVPPSCPCTIFGSSTPSVVNGGDSAAVNLGVKFTSDTNGFVTGVRFYKAAANGGAHVGSLWDSGGTLLAQATFSGETASGWQSVLFSSPVAVTAGTTYVASYLAPNGDYSTTSAAFASTGVNAPPLYALATTTAANGVYAYGGVPAFPTNTFNATNYWVDATFTTGAATAPGVPTGVSATAGNTSATVSWNAPATGGSPISSYTVTPFIGAAAQTASTVSGSVTTATVSGLTNGTAYTFTVTATNGIGTGAASAPSNAVTPNVSVTAPTAPTGVSASAGNAQATVSWTAPANGGSPITSYTVTPFIGATAQTATTVSGSPPATTATVTGLTNGTTYTFTVAATNTAGSGPASTGSNPVTPTATVATCPCTIFGTATPSVVDSADTIAVNLGVKFTSDSNGFVTGVRFYKAAANTGTHVGSVWSLSGTLLGQVTFSGESASGWQQALFSTPVAVTAGTTYVVSYLDPNGHYSVNGAAFATAGVNTPPLHALATTVTPNGVYAYSGATTFPTNTYNASNYWVDAVFSLSAPTAPLAPTAVTATAGPASATVSWTAPANGGSPISSYTVTPFIGAAAQTATTVSGAPPATTATVTGLTNGTAYTFTVTATNGAGTSPASAASAPVTPVSAPAAPTGVAAGAGNAQATVSWTAPVSGGSPITSYKVTPFIGPTAQTATTVSGSPPATTATVTGLTNGTTYTFTVAATNSAGSGPASTGSNPVTPTATAATCPCTIFGTATPSVVDSADTVAVNLGVKFTSDSNGFVTGVRFYKAAANTGTHVGSVWSLSGTLLGQVTFSGESASGWQQALFSTPVAVTAGTTYVVSYLDPKGHYSVNASAFATAGVDTPPLHALATTVTPNGVYAYSGTTAFPTNTYNASNYWVDALFDTTGASVPAAPTGVSATGGNASATVSWTAPANGGSPISSYTVTPFIGATAQTASTVSGSVTTATVSGLTNGTAYTFTVTAANAIGSGQSSTASNAVTPAAVPSAPTGVSAGAGNAQATVTWTAPASGGSPISSYTVTPFIGATAQTATTVSGSPPATTTTITGLVNATTYTFTVAATNTAGTGPASTGSNPVTPTATGPSCPCTIFGTATPSVVDSGDTNAVNLGVQFTSDSDGFVTGVRFYKAAANTGTHVGSVWTSTGTLLGSVTFSGESASGWQQALFSTPVAVTAGTTYVVSYLDPNGHYSVDGAAFATAGVDTPPLHALATTVAPNGVYGYSGTTTFPTNTFNASNYWVDPIFSL